GYAQALAILEELAATHPERFEARHDLVECHRELGNLLATGPSRAEAERHYREAVRLGRELVESSPERDGARYSLACAQFQLANLVRLDRARLGEALDLMTECRGMIQQLVADRPAQAGYRHAL